MSATLDLTTVEVEGGPLVLASHAAVDDLEQRLGVRFPDGYREYVTLLGEGQLEALVRVHPPWGVLEELDAHRGLMAAYWSWHDEPAFGQHEATESIPLGDTVDGDAILFHPADRTQIVVLPRHDERLFLRGADLLEVVEWLCAGGTGSIAGPGRTFAPYDSRRSELPAEGGREGRHEVPRQVLDTTPPALDGSARTVLLAYFAELAAVESWGTAQAGGPESFLGEWPPPMALGATDELVARSDAVHVRYCTPRLATALAGSSVTLSSSPAHDPAAIQSLDEVESRPGRVVIHTVEGIDLPWRREYILARTGGAWRISVQRDVGPADGPTPKRP